MEFEAEIALAAPIERVFHLVDDPREFARRQPTAVVVLADPAAPRAPGHRYVLRVEHGGRVYDSTCEIVAREPPRLLVLTTTSEFGRYTTEWRLRPLASGTCVKARAFTPRETGLAAVFGRLLVDARTKALIRSAVFDQLQLLGRAV